MLALTTDVWARCKVLDDSHAILYCSVEKGLRGNAREHCAKVQGEKLFPQTTTVAVLDTATSGTFYGRPSWEDVAGKIPKVEHFLVSVHTWIEFEAFGFL